MTLREEIHEYVYQHNKDEYGKCEECEYRTKQILKIFEKLIDEKIQEQKTHEFHLQSKLDTYEELKEELSK